MPYMPLLVSKILECFRGGLSSLGNIISHGYGSVNAHWDTVIFSDRWFNHTKIWLPILKITTTYWIVPSRILLFLVGRVFGIAKATIALTVLLVALSSVLLKSLD